MKRKRHKYEKERKFRTAAVLWVIPVLLVCGVVWGIQAKYFQKSEADMLAEAKMFYFTSNLLTEDGAYYELNPDTKYVTIEVRNYEDALRVSEDAIQVEYWIGDEEGDEVIKLTGGIQELEKYELVLEPGQKYEFRAVGTAGYQKTLSATFQVLEYEEGFYQYLDTSDPYYVVLTVWTKYIPEDGAGNVSITVPDGLLPDDTDPDLKTVTDTITTQLGDYQSESYRFFKQDLNQSVSVGDFHVTMDGKAATDGTP